MKMKISMVIFFISSLILTAQLNDKWVDAGSIPNYKYISRHSAVLLKDGNVLITGGFLNIADTLYHPSAQSFTYDHITDNWVKVASLKYGRENHSAILLKNGKVLVSGGDNGSDATKKCELYDPVIDNWTETDSMKYARACSASILLPNGNVMVIGGYYIDYLMYAPAPVYECEIYNSIEQKWVEAAELIEPLDYKPSVGLVNDSLIFAVQYNNISHYLSFQLYNLMTNQWILLPRANIISSTAKAVGIGDSLLVVIDSEGNCEIFNFYSFTWETADSTDFNRKNHFHLSKLSNRYILVHSGGISRTDIFDVKTRRWIRGEDMPDIRSTGTSTVLQNGNVLVIGGNDTLSTMAIKYIPDSTVVVGIENDEVIIPLSFILYQNYPNPFNPSTTIKYAIPAINNRQATKVKLLVYDLLGREVATLVNREKAPGSYQVNFDGSNLPSGLYFYKLTAGNYSAVKKMILMK